MYNKNDSIFINYVDFEILTVLSSIGSVIIDYYLPIGGIDKWGNFKI